MKSRDRAYRLARSSGSAADFARFRSLRAQASNALDSAKNGHVACRLADAPTAEAKWRELRHTVGTNRFFCDKFIYPEIG